MKPETEKLLGNLEAVTENLYYMSETDAPYESFVWDVSEKGAFHFVRVLESVNCLKTSTTEQVNQRASVLVKILQDNLSNVSFWQFAKKSLILGQTTEGDWVGIAEKFVYSTCEFGSPYKLPAATPTPAATQIKASIEPLLSEQVSENAANCDDLILKLLSSSSLLEMWIFEDLQAEDSADLVSFLHNNLKNILVYVFPGLEDAEFLIYTIGETPTGDYLGVKTVAVWT